MRIEYALSDDFANRCRDLDLICDIFLRLGLGEFMPYNGGRDTRTVFDMARYSYEGTKHHALMDAIDQAEAVHDAMAKIGLRFVTELAQDISRWTRPTAAR